MLAKLLGGPLDGLELQSNGEHRLTFFQRPQYLSHISSFTEELTGELTSSELQYQLWRKTDSAYLYKYVR